MARGLFVRRARAAQLSVALLISRVATLMGRGEVGRKEGADAEVIAPCNYNQLVGASPYMYLLI